LSILSKLDLAMANSSFGDMPINAKQTTAPVGEMAYISPPPLVAKPK
jgi:hypothetical protein